MIIKSHVRGGYRAAANYLKQQGSNESVRLVEIGDTSARNLDEAFRNMWMVGRTTRCSKPLHHVSINPYKDERLTDEQVRLICARLEQKFGYKPGDHQRVIIEHIKDGRQHFHVIWNRVSMRTGRPVWPGEHWNKSKQAAREMEAELSLKRPEPRRGKKARTRPKISKRKRSTGDSRAEVSTKPGIVPQEKSPIAALGVAGIPRGPLRRGGHPQIARPPAGLSLQDLLISIRTARGRQEERDEPDLHLPTRPRNSSIDEIIAWAWEHRRADVLAMFGIYVSFNL